jgi:hypothetical protein
MKRYWTLAELGELFRLFPPDAARCGAVLRCVRAARGEGRFIRKKNREGFCGVTLQAWPADEFSLTCTYEWPAGVRPVEAEDLDRALLQGVVEGAGEVEQPPWRASIVCPAVIYKAGLTNADAVRSAASLAVQDLVDHGEWIVEGSPPKDVA